MMVREAGRIGATLVAGNRVGAPDRRMGRVAAVVGWVAGR